MPNPFLLEGVAANEPRKAGPPGRPPPPNMATSSPAHAPPPKSAFDDLNDTIRMALGNSPAKPPLNTGGMPLGTAAPPNPAGQYPTQFQPSPAKAQTGLNI